MHEFHLIADLMKRIEGVAAKQKARKVVGVEVWLGALSHFSEEHFREHFEQASRGTTAEGAKLKMELSRDERHPDAQGVILKNVKLEVK